MSDLETPSSTPMTFEQAKARIEATEASAESRASLEEIGQHFTSLKENQNDLYAALDTKFQQVRTEIASADEAKKGELEQTASSLLALRNQLELQGAKMPVRDQLANAGTTILDKAPAVDEVVQRGSGFIGRRFNEAGDILNTFQQRTKGNKREWMTLGTAVALPTLAQLAVPQVRKTVLNTENKSGFFSGFKRLAVTAALLFAGTHLASRMYLDKSDRTQPTIAQNRNAAPEVASATA